MIYDCFLFFHELEVLDIRLHELDSVVDKFVLVESTVTHTNQQKKLFYNENKHLFKKFEKKIIHIIVKDSPNVSHPWIINGYQFDQISRGLVNAKDNDIILFGDLDEIPKASLVKKWLRKVGKHKVFLQRHSYYFLNLVLKKQKNNWMGTHMMRYKDLKKLSSPWIGKFSPPDILIPDGGWHFAYIGDVKRIQMKISATPHQELNRQGTSTPENIIAALKLRKDVFGRNIKFEKVYINGLPDYVKENKSKFAAWLLTEDNNQDFESFVLFYLKIKHYLRLSYRFIRRYIRKKVQ